MLALDLIYNKCMLNIILFVIDMEVGVILVIIIITTTNNYLLNSDFQQSRC